MTTATATKHEAVEVTLTRTLNAPRALVFKLWTEPKHMAQWWGPRGFTNPRCELDVRPGGKIHIDMKGPDGTVYPMSGTFHEIVPNERLVFLAVAEDAAGKPLLQSLTAVTFEERGGKTTLTVHARGTAIQEIGWQMLQGMKEGWSQSLERLERLAAKA